MGYEAAGSRSSYPTWIGVSDRNEEGSFVYESDGTSLTYDNWASGYGIDRGEIDITRECGLMFYSGNYQWITTYCNDLRARFRYICELVD